MAGQFTHILLVDSVCTPEAVAKLGEISPSMRTALLDPAFQPFCRFGAITPDAPQFSLGSDDFGFTDLMHYGLPSDLVRYAIPRIWKMNFSETDTRACIAWIFGYTAHIVADCTVHPVVSALVGPYSVKKNQKPHRLCEFHQDVYIFNQRTGQEIVTSDFKHQTRMDVCSQGGNLHHFNKRVGKLWSDCLLEYPSDLVKQYVRLPSKSIAPDKWYATYFRLMAQHVTKPGGLLGVFGLSYMPLARTDPKSYTDLPTPYPGQTIMFDDLFELTRKNIIAAWTELAVALETNNPSAFTLPNANLDTGEFPKSLYWS